MTKSKRIFISVFALAVSSVISVTVFLKTNDQSQIPEKVKQIVIDVFRQSHQQSKILIYKRMIKPDEVKVIAPFIDSQDQERENTRKIIVENPSWLFIVDDTPSANFAHPITVGLINADTFKITQAKFDWWPTLKDTELKKITDLPYYNKDRRIQDIFCDISRFKLDCPTPCSDSPFPSNKNFYAILIAGGFSSDNNNMDFAKDVDCMYSVLIRNGVPESNIYAFMTKEVQDKILQAPTGNETQFTFSHQGNLNNKGKQISKPDIVTAFQQIKNQIKNRNQNDGKFLFLMSSHGLERQLLLNDNKEFISGDDDPNSISLKNLHDWIKDINLDTYIFIDTCFSGSFVGVKFSQPNTYTLNGLSSDFCLQYDVPAGKKRIIIVSTCNGETFNADIDCHVGPEEDIYDRGTEFMGAFIDAFANTPSVKVSLEKAFQNACQKACYVVQDPPISSTYKHNHPYWIICSPDKKSGVIEHYISAKGKKNNIYTLKTEYLF